MKSLKKLPLGIQAFETFGRDNYLYVDKTEYVFHMIDQGMFYFFARPRRFGKSLMVSVLKCLFQGKKELFESLWIAEPGRWEWKEHPVIIIDFNGITHDTPENLQAALGMCLEDTAHNYNIELKKPLLKEKFRELIIALWKKTEIPVVILVDEYDKPIIDHLGKGEDAMKTARANRDILKNFFGVLKDTVVSPLLRFVFITGVSKFSRVSIFSELNNLEDISMNQDYADMLGYTRKEMETCFGPYISEFAARTSTSETEIIEKLEYYYDGYRFSERDTKVCNPFSVLSALKNRKFKNYWFETGTPTFLVNLLREKNYNLAKIENMEVSEAVLSSYDIENLGPEAILFQNGYLTIRNADEGIYTLNYPNHEVKKAFLKYLLFSFTQEFNRI